MNSGHDQAVAQRAEDLAAEGRIHEAFNLLQAALTRGDAFAAATMADWRMSGIYIRRDLKAARTLFGRAAELGLDAAAPVHIALLANGAGGGRDWPRAIALLRKRAAQDALAQRQIALLDAMEIDTEGNPVARPEPAALNDDPPIRAWHGFLSSAECQYLVEQAGPVAIPSVVIHPQTGTAVQDPVRRAKAAGFPFVREDPVIHAINRRIAMATNLAPEHGEPAQILVYDPGDEYRLHSDALPFETNQRVATFLVTLADTFEGGETAFPRLGIEWRGRTGDALEFRNVDAQGRPAAAMWHEGRPVTRGRKVLFSKWIRAAPLNLSGPPGRPF
jgi:prolyl 4-hydroxylase